MKQHPLWEASIHSVSQDITCVLSNMKVYYLVHTSQSLDSVLNYLIPVHYLTFGFYVHFNVTSSAPRSRKWSLSFQFSDWNFDLISLKYLMQITNCEAPHYAPELSLLLFLSLKSIYCPQHPSGRHRHWHNITKWLLPCIYIQHIGPVFVKCHFPIVELDILPLKLWPCAVS